MGEGVFRTERLEQLQQPGPCRALVPFAVAAHDLEQVIDRILPVSERQQRGRKIEAGAVSNEIMSHLDWVPTLMAAAGEPEIKEKLKKIKLVI